MRWFVCCGAVLLLLCGARAAFAQDAAASAADALFQSGKSAMGAGDIDAACERFRESFRLQAAVGTLLNLGACEEKRGHAALAAQCFRDSLAMLGDGDYRRAFAQARLEALRPRLASVRLAVEGPVPPSLRVRGDDVELGTASLGIELWVDAGEHVYVASAPGYPSAIRRIRLAEGQRSDVVFRMIPVASPPSSPKGPTHAAPVSRPEVDAPRSTPIGPYVLLGTGGAALVAGAVFGVVVMDAASDVRTHCDASGCDPQGVDAAHRGRPYATLSPLALGAGAALAGTGVLWLALSRTTKVRPIASPSTQAFGASLGGSF